MTPERVVDIKKIFVFAFMRGVVKIVRTRGGGVLLSS